MTPGGDDPTKRDEKASPKPLAALRQIQESADTLVKQGKSDEAWQLAFAALEAVLVKNRDQELLIAKLYRDRSPLAHKSERMDPNQMLLLEERMSELPHADEAVDVDAQARQDAQLDGEIDTAEASKPVSKNRPKREAGLEGAQKQIHRVEPDPADRRCPTCGKDKTCIGHDVTRRFEFVPAKFVEHVYELAKYACTDCKESVTTAPAPVQVIERSPVGASLLSHVVISKMLDHTPLHRLSRGYARDGVELAVSTLADWMAGAGRLVEPLVVRLGLRVMKATIIRTDATGLRVIDLNSPDNAVWGTMWCRIGDDRDVVFEYTPTGDGESGPWKTFAGREGYIQADAASVFDRLFNGRAASAIEVGCWAHARRRFVALQDMDCRVAYPLKLIARLYRIEHLGDARELSPPERTALRQERSVPVLDQLLRWFVSTYKSEPPSSDLAKAVAYAVNHWAALNRFTLDGRLSLDNNLCEQQLRDIACGRKNYLFAGSHDAARRAAALYSLTRTCVQYKRPPVEYFTDVFTKLGEGWSGERLDQLLPNAWRPPNA